MKYAICLQPYIPIRFQPEEQSEMISQLLFGDLFIIEDEKPRWYYVCRDSDGYRGWIDWKTATVISDKEYSLYQSQVDDAPLLRLPFNPLQRTAGGKSGSVYLSWGSRIYNLDDTGITFRMQNVRFDVPSMSYINPVKASTMSRKACAKFLMQQAQMLLNVPYLWGGISAFGSDCSGFTQTLFRFVGISLPRDASQQVLKGTAIALEDADLGDLAFFGSAPDHITHVGMVADGGRILHVSGSLHFDQLRQEGIWSEERQELTHQLQCIRRFF